MQSPVKLTERIENHFKLQKVKNDEFSSMKVGPMKIQTMHWNAGLLGNVSYMEGTAIFGLMRMRSMIVTPREIDMPLLSMDIVKVAGKVTALCELYDTCLGGFDGSELLEIKNSVSSFAGHRSDARWYDSLRLEGSWSCEGRKTDLPVLETAIEKMLGLFCEKSSAMPVITDPETLKAKQERVNSYVDGLLEHGGTSTDLFLKKFGKEKTSELFHTVLF